MAFKLSQESSKALWALVALSRDMVKDEWVPRLNRDQELLAGRHWNVGDQRGLKPIVNNMIGRIVAIKNAANVYRSPSVEATPTASDEDLMAAIRSLELPGMAQPDQNAPMGLGGPPPVTTPPNPLMGLVPGAPPGLPIAPLTGLQAPPMGLGGPPQGPMGAPSPPPVQPTGYAARRLLSIIISERLRKIFMASGGWDASKSALFDKRWAGIGIVFTGWDSGSNDPIDAAGMKDILAQFQELAGMAGIDPSGLELPNGPVTGEGVKTWRISPYDFIIDPTVDAFNFREASYMGRVYQVQKETLEKDGGFSKSEMDQLSANATTQTDNENFVLDPAQQDRKKDADHPTLTLCEVWFRKVWLKRGYTETKTDDETGERNTVHYPAGWYPIKVTWSIHRPADPISVELWPYDLRNDRMERLYPFDLLIARPVPGKLKGQSDCEVGEPQQLEMNHARAVEATYADWLARLKFVAKGSLSREAKDAIRSLVVGDIIELPENMREVADAIYALPVPGVKPEVEAASEHAKEDMNANTGVSDAAQGEVLQGEHTLGEAQLVTNLSGSRAALDGAEFEDFLSSVADKQWQIECQMQHVGGQVSVSLPKRFGGLGTPTSLFIDKEHLLPAQVTVTTGVTLTRNRQEKVQGIVQAFQILGAAGLLAGPNNPMGLYNSEYLGDELLSALDLDGDPELKDTHQFVEAALEQAQQQAQMMAQSAQAQGAMGGPSPNGMAPPGLRPAA